MMFARTGTVLINRPTIDSAPASSAGRPETVVPKATSCWPVSQHQQLREGALQHGVDGGVVRARQLAKGPRGLAQAPETMPRLAAPAPTDPADPTSVGVSKPANTSRQAARAASRSRPASQVTKLRYEPGRGQPLPVIAGEYFPQQDRQRPAIEHDVVIGQHKPVPVCCGADQRRPKGRLVGQIADRGAFGGAHPLDLLIDIDAVAGVQVDIPPRQPRDRPG